MFDVLITNFNDEGQTIFLLIARIETYPSSKYIPFTVAISMRKVINNSMSLTVEASFILYIMCIYILNDKPNLTSQRFRYGHKLFSGKLHFSNTRLMGKIYDFQGPSAKIS